MDDDNANAGFPGAQCGAVPTRKTHLESASDSLGDRIFQIRAADSFRDRNWAHRLVDKMYATRGYQTRTAADERASNRKTFVASDQRGHGGTLTIGFDSSDGLVVESLFPDEVAKFRDADGQMCEFTRLAMDRTVRSPRVLAALFHVAHIYAHRVKKLKTLLVEVNPRHVRYYQTMLAFEVAAQERHDPRVNAPAVLMALDLSHAQEQISRFGGQPHLAISERSAYPHFYSQDDADIIVKKLTNNSSNVVDIANVHEPRRVRLSPSHTVVPVH